MTTDRTDEIIRHFDLMVGRLQTQISQVAEAIVRLGEELEASRSEVAVEFSELRSMVNFSYTPLPNA